MSKKTPKMDTEKFFNDDLMKTLFPMDTNQLLIKFGQNKIKEFIGKIRSEEEANDAFSFLPQ